jgi:CRISPR-associated protein Csm4
MKLYHLRLRPVSSWMTPWQSDTLSGALCWAMARTLGEETLRREILEPALRNRPPFVLSDAFPGDLLPVPAALRLREWPVEHRKAMKRARWLLPETFRAARSGQTFDSAEIPTDSPFLSGERLRNTLSRTSDTTGEEGSLFSCEEFVLNTRPSCFKEQDYLTVYARAADGYESRLKLLFKLLARTGFGADTSTGRGQFEVASDLEPAEGMEEAEYSANGVVVLSTFQPAVHDPTEGCWELLTKHGKVGPDFGLENVFKRPLILMRPGACFRCEVTRPYLGRAVPMDDLLAEADAARLRGMNADILHYAYGLAVPCRLPEEEI